MQAASRIVTFSYRELTDNSKRRISQLMEEARKRQGGDSLRRREWAYGLYIGWRAIVADRVDPEIYRHDDEILESLLKVF